MNTVESVDPDYQRGQLAFPFNKVVIPGLDPGALCLGEATSLHERLGNDTHLACTAVGSSDGLEWVPGSSPGMTP